MATIEELLKPVQNRKDPRSELQKAQAQSDKDGGDPVNACPFGCEQEDLDHNGYCCHLIGFTNDKKFMEPLKMNHRGMRTVQVRHTVQNGKRVPVLDPVPKGAKFIRISISYRVYHEDGRDPEILPDPPMSIPGAAK